MSLVTDVVQITVQRRPLLLRTLLGLARRQKPVLRAGDTVLVTSADAVREVFERPDDFLFGHGNAPKMKLGPFLLGMDRSAVYEREKRALRAAITRGAVAAIGAHVEDECARIELKEGITDVASAFIEPVLARATARFYGVDLANARTRLFDVQHGEGAYAHWLRALGGAVGSSWPAPFGLEAIATASGEEMSAFLNGEAARVQPATGPAFESVIAELKRLHGDGVSESPDIARCVGGMMLAGAAMMKAATLALHQLALRGDALRACTAAARAGDRAQVLAYVWEALRFQPVFPLLPRYTPRATVLGAGKPYATDIPAGATVLVSPMAAMFDPLRVDDAEAFVPGRPPATYLHFGHDLHRCLGERLADEALYALFKGALTRFRPQPGTLRFAGPIVIGYRVRLEIRGAHEANRVDHPRAA